MTMIKKDRKAAYVEIINKMIAGDNDAAFSALTLMCGSDTGLFVLASYKDARAAYEDKQKANQ